MEKIFFICMEADLLIYLRHHMELMHKLNKQTRESLFKKVGLTYEQMQRMGAEEIDAFIEKRMGKKLTFGTSLKNLINRGSVYLFSKHLYPMSEVDRRLAKI